MVVRLLTDHSATARRGARFHDEDTSDENVSDMNEADESSEEAHFRKHMFYVASDVIARFSAAKQISDAFSVRSIFKKISKEEL